MRVNQSLRCEVGSVTARATRALSVIIAKGGRRIGMEVLMKIQGGSTRSCEYVLMTLMGQGWIDAPATNIVYQ